jgi:MFS family permease
MSFTSRWSDVYLIAGCRGVSVCGDFLAATTLALVLQQAGHGGLAVSGLMLAAAVPLAVLAPVAGRVADRADSRTVLVVSGLAQAAICLALAFVTRPEVIIALVAALACGLAITQPTQAALVPEMVRPADLAKANGLTQTAGVLGMTIAPALAGLLVGRSGARLPLLLDAASYLALVAAGFLVRTRRRGGAPAPRTRSGPWRFRDDRTLVVMAGALTAVVAGVSAINVIEVFFIRDTLGASTTVFGLVAAAWTVGMLIGAAGFSRLGRPHIGVPGLLGLAAGSCASVVAAAAVPSALWMIPLWIIGGVCNGGINIFSSVIVADRAPVEARGRAFAVLAAVVQGGSLLGLLAAGPLVEHFDPRVLVAAAGAAGLIAAIGCLPVVRVRPEPPPRPLTGGSASARDSVG